MLTTRNTNGQFAAGNPGGPGRPRKRAEVHRHFLSTVQRIIEHPERFTTHQRDAMVRLVTSFMEGTDQEAIAAATVLIEMEGENIDRDRIIDEYGRR